MKVVFSHSTASKKSASPKMTNIISLVENDEEELSAECTVTFSLRSAPANPDSPKYKRTCRVLVGGETVRTIVRWYLQAQKVLTGLHIQWAFMASKQHNQHTTKQASQSTHN